MKTKTIDNMLPKIMDYTNFLNKAIEKFNISIEEARTKYGRYTYKQWEELLIKNN